jgi:hypothetical protein
MLWRGVVIAALALIVGGLIVHVLPAGPTVPPPRATPTPAAAFLPLAGLGCVGTAAWDPTSTYIAVAGTPDTFCGASGYATNVVNIYRAGTSALARRLHPDPAVFAALGIPPPTPVTPVPQSPPQEPRLTYDSLLWSPDGTEIALNFSLATYGTSYQAASGLVVLAARGSGERVLVDRTSGPPPAYEVWDLRTGSARLVGSYPLAGLPGPINTLPPALSYGWSADGTLVPGGQLATGATASPRDLDLVGNPDGGQTFGLWQPGQILVIAVQPKGQAVPTTLDVYQTTFAAWSPDGRFLVDHLTMGGLLLVPGQPIPSQTMLSAAQLDGAAVLTVRDAGLQQALAHDAPQPVNLGPNAPAELLPLAWRPDGNALALLTLGNGYIVRDAAAGRVLKTAPIIELPPSAQAAPGEFASLSGPLWSPDGTWMLLPALALVHVGPLRA